MIITIPCHCKNYSYNLSPFLVLIFISELYNLCYILQDRLQCIIMSHPKVGQTMPGQQILGMGGKMLGLKEGIKLKLQTLSFEL